MRGWDFLRISDWGFHTVRGGIDPGGHRFRPRFVDPGMGSCPPRVALVPRTPGWRLAVSPWGWGFHTMRSGIDPGNRRFRPR